jgi:hypothetical protein
VAGAEEVRGEVEIAGTELRSVHFNPLHPISGRPAQKGAGVEIFILASRFDARARTRVGRPFGTDFL